MGEEREQLMEQLEALSRKCGGCQKNPISGNKNRVTWCNSNCTDVAPQMRIIGNRLDVVAARERRARKNRIARLPNDNFSRKSFLEAKKEADAATSDLMAL